MTKAPVMVLLYNRPDKVRRVMENVRAYQPERLYLVADHWPEKDVRCREACLQARETAQQLSDTADSVTHIYADRHLGCRFRPATGISDVLEREESVIILEDDCVPAPGFFEFCSNLLETYRMEEQVMMIGGSNALSHQPADGADVFFSRYPQTWGWATWRRAWSRYDTGLTHWPEAEQALAASGLHPQANAHLQQKLHEIVTGGLDAWDYGWSLTLALHGGLAALPRCSLIRNIGFGPGATHTLSPIAGRFQPATGELHPPFQFPDGIRADEAHDERYAIKNFTGPVLALREQAHRLLRRIRAR